MKIGIILWRSMKWRFQNPISILITIIQPMIWLLLYSNVAGKSMENITGNYVSFIFPGIMMLVSFAASCSGGIINYIMKTNGSFYRILIAPISRSSIVLGQLLEAVALSFFEIFILFLIGLCMSVQIHSGLLGAVLIIIVMFLSSFFMSGLAYSISLCLRSEVIYETVMNTVVLPLFFMSSALFPVEQISGGVKIAILLNPFTHIINVVRELISSNVIHFQQPILIIAVFIILDMCILILAIHLLKRENNQ